MTLSKPLLALVVLCAVLAGALGRDLLVPSARADDPTGLRSQDVRELLRVLERNAEATKDVAEAVRGLKR